MRLRLFLLALVAAVSIGFIGSSDAQALGLKVAPLEYRTSLKAGEGKTGFIDVSNPSSQTMTVRVSTQAFRQISNDGGLEFYDDDRIAAGIKPELGNFTLGARQALRLYFTISGEKLPKGDVYAAIFLTSATATPRTGVGQLVRVGTLLSIVNQTPGERSAEITRIRIPFLQLSDTLQGSYTVKNTGSHASGFYPTVTIKESPGGRSITKISSLVFGGRQRENDFEFATGAGLRYVEVSYGKSHQGTWVLLLEPWMLVVFIVIGLIIVTELVLMRRRHMSRKNSATSGP